MKHCTIYIKGMHCRSCEILIEDELKKVPHVKHVSVHHQQGIADVSFTHTLDKRTITNAVENAGYRIGTDGKPSLFSRNQRDYVDVSIAFFIATALFLIATSLGIFNLGSTLSGNYSSLPIVFLVGLTAGVSTCMALVGGLVLGASARFSLQHPSASGIEKFTPHLFFNIGRIASYVVLGGLIGFAGSFFQLSTSLLGMLIVITGFVMLFLGGQLLHIFPILDRISITLPTGLYRIFGIDERSAQAYSNKNATIMGALTFFLPCGFTQAIQLYAMSTGSFFSGALTMGVFALGTAPGLLGVGGLIAIVKGRIARLFFKTAGVVVTALALFNVSNGLNLLGIGPKVLGSSAVNSASKNSAADPNVSMSNGVQEIRMTQTASGYSPNTFTIRKGIPARWIITSKNGTSCASSIVSQKLGISSNLQLGENTINFTPTEAGTIRFSCSMGMYVGSFRVVDGSESAADSSTGILARAQANFNPPGTSCGNNGSGCGCGMGAAQ